MPFRACHNELVPRCTNWILGFPDFTPTFCCRSRYDSGTESFSAGVWWASRASSGVGQVAVLFGGLRLEIASQVGVNVRAVSTASVTTSGDVRRAGATVNMFWVPEGGFLRGWERHSGTRGAVVLTESLKLARYGQAHDLSRDVPHF